MKNNYLNFWAMNRDRQKRKDRLQEIGSILLLATLFAIGGTGTFPY